MAAQAAAFLEKANWLTALDRRRLGFRLAAFRFKPARPALHTLVGYTDQPTAMQLSVYLAVLALTFVLMRLYGTPAKTVTSAPAE